VGSCSPWLNSQSPAQPSYTVDGWGPCTEQAASHIRLRKQCESELTFKPLDPVSVVKWKINWDFHRRNFIVKNSK
jgi:hypothetical protein